VVVHWLANSKGIAHSVDDLLTTRQLQDLLQVDRITIYRMLNDGRLRGFKVGGQWRFSRREIDAWLQEQQTTLDVADVPSLRKEAIPPSPQVLPLSCVQAIQDVCADALDIAAVTTSLEGTPLTDVSNPCDFCSLILSTDEGQHRCRAAWARVGNGQIHACHAGLLCISVPIEISGQAVAITAGCQFVTQPVGGLGPAWQADLLVLAADLGLAERDLGAATDSVRVVTENYLSRVSRLLQRIATTFAEIGEERLSLLSRLQHIAEMSKI
jgi:excisionase family DNA binding protein